jgi:hypothetical protein
MTISAQQSRLIWTPLLGWALLSSSMVAAQDQTQQQQQVQPAAPGSGGVNVYGTLTPTPGAPGTTTPTETTPAEGTTVLTPAPPPAPTGTPSATVVPALPPLSAVQTLPSANQTIIDAPFGTSIPIVLAAGSGGGGGASGGPDGISLGSFTLHSGLDINVGYDNNVFTQNPNATSSSTTSGGSSSSTAPTTGTLYTTVAPVFDLVSDWSNHSLHLTTGALLGFYPNAPSQNYQAFQLGGDGRIDIRTDWSLIWGAAFRQSIEPLGTPNTTQASAPTVVNTIPLLLGMNQHFNRFFYGFNANATQTSYVSSSLPTTGTLTPDDRANTSYGETLTLGYDVTEDFSVSLNPGLNQVRYRTPINSLGQARDSDGQTVGLGATYRFNPINSLAGNIGYTTLKTGALGATSAMLFGLSGSWNGYEPLVLRPNISRSIQQTPEGNYRNYISTQFGLDYSYLIHEDWTLTGGISYTLADYQPIDGNGATPRQDAFFRGQIGFLYSLRPDVQIGPVFEYTQGSTSDPANGPTFSRQLFSVRLSARR